MNKRSGAAGSGGGLGPETNYLTEDGERMDHIAGEIRVCARCPLSETRKNAVPGEGPAPSALVFVGEAPGAREDVQGRPFVGSAGKLLAGLLKKNGILREETFITNTVKCRPPGNRPPTKEEMACCAPYLRRQLAALRPALVCTLGNSPLHALVDERMNITEMHGHVIEREGIRFFPLYHPAAILYRRKLMADMERDFQSMARLARPKRKGLEDFMAEGSAFQEEP
jgi:uracil-DNA glycosylase family 4